MSYIFTVRLRRICLFISYVLLLATSFSLDAVADSFPVDLSGTAPEQASVTLNVYKPSDAVNGILTLSAYDADAPREGELVINGNPSIRLFNSLGVAENDKTLVDITISTPASYWNDGDNKLTFYHVRSGGYSINGATVLFDGSQTPGPGPVATFSVDSIDFGGVDVGGISNSIPLTLTNSGADPLNISGVSISSSFTQTNNCSSSLPAGGYCIFDIQFVPKSTGEIEGALTITGNTEEKYHVISLSGTGGTAVKQSSNNSLIADSTAPELILYRDFNDEALHTYTASEVRSTWNAENVGIKGDAVKIVRDPESDQAHGNVLRIFYAANSYGRRNDSGAQWTVNIGAHDELYFAYDVYFEDDAEFVRGGKLPGLMSTGYYSDPATIPDGTDRWTGGMMWFDNGKIINYMYHADQSANYGDRIGWDDGSNGQQYFQRGRWHRLELYYKMNTPGVLDGRLKGWLDGELALDTNEIMYRMPGGEDLDIGTFAFKTFYGGGNKTWAPSTDQYIYFDNFVISTKPITH